MSFRVIDLKYHCLSLAHHAAYHAQFAGLSEVVEASLAPKGLLDVVILCHKAEQLSDIVNACRTSQQYLFQCLEPQALVCRA